MTTVTSTRRVSKTGRPLGVLDVLSKIAETALIALTAWKATRRATALANGNGQRDISRDAADLRRMANHYRSSAPGFASDLYAAADRHELLLAR